jgi:hypothetical protein
MKNDEKIIEVRLKPRFAFLWRVVFCFITRKEILILYKQEKNDEVSS